MSTSQNPELEIPAESIPAESEQKKQKLSLLDRILKQLSSVPFGIFLLVLMIIMSMTGMLIMQVNVDGFEKYFATLTPSQRWLYTDPILQMIRGWTGLPLKGWNILSLVDIYKSYVFITVLAILTLNIILASIDHFPGAWRYIRRKKLTASRPYVQHQAINATLDSDGTDEEALRLAAACRQNGFTPTITREAKRTTVFAERGAWNRLGAYFVHVGLLVIFLAGFLTWRSAHTGMMTLVPGSEEATIQGPTYDVNGVKLAQYALPFKVECTDIQQTLIKKDGTLDANNTIDWHTRIAIEDPTTGQPIEGDVHMNKPFDYRGYRFFQSSYQNIANARSVTLDVRRASAAPEEVTLLKNQIATLSDGTQIRFSSFSGNAASGAEAIDYSNPVATIQVLAPGASKAQQVTARPEGSGDTANMAASTSLGGTTIVLKDFEKVGGSHTLSVQYDPGAWVFYVGSVMLVAALMSVFFFAHQRIWFVIEPDKDGVRKVFAGGHTNRNRPAFDKKFKDVMAAFLPPAQS